ncbi:MAG TPA: non-canonical purine NTP pyrophosphatase [Candidatus Moranbacteria bacterium]|nr:non-canonical purine NTP pyrophosphatase [Candidatus Moranbacteria bacterium]
MKILIATHNPSKFERYKRILEIIDFLEPVSLADLGITEKVEENYATNVENALHKARTYGKLSGMITVAVDEALMTNFLPDNEQPGVYARRFAKDKKEQTDEELIEIWKEIFKAYSQEDKKFIWNFAVAFYNPKNDSEGVECVEEISHVAKYFSPIKSNGYPMSTFLSFSLNGIPYIEMSQKEKDHKDIQNFASFVDVFNRWLLSEK